MELSSLSLFPWALFCERQQCRCIIMLVHELCIIIFVILLHLKSRHPGEKIPLSARRLNEDVLIHQTIRRDAAFRPRSNVRVNLRQQNFIRGRDGLQQDSRGRDLSDGLRVTDQLPLRGTISEVDDQQLRAHQNELAFEKTHITRLFLPCRVSGDEDAPKPPKVFVTIMTLTDEFGPSFFGGVHWAAVNEENKGSTGLWMLSLCNTIRHFRGKA